jgi:hypothetical protein
MHSDSADAGKALSVNLPYVGIFFQVSSIASWSLQNPSPLLQIASSELLLYYRKTESVCDTLSP